MQRPMALLYHQLMVIQVLTNTSKEQADLLILSIYSMKVLRDIGRGVSDHICTYDSM